MKKKYLIRFIGFALLIVILLRIDWHYLWLSLKRVPIEYFFIAIPLFISTVWAKSVRWGYILKVQRIDLAAWETFTYYAASVFWGVVTPGRVGEAIKIYYLNRHGVTTGKATLSVILDRFFDLGFLLIFFAAGLLVILNAFSWRFVVLILICIGLFLIISYKTKGKILKGTILSVLYFTPEKYKERVSVFFEDLVADLNSFSAANLLVLALYTVFTWVIYALPLFLLGRGIGLQVSPLVLVSAIWMAAAIAMLPISIGGVGTRDGFMIIYLGRAGVESNTAVLFSFMFLYMYLVNMLVGYLMFLKRDVKNSKRTQVIP